MKRKIADWRWAFALVPILLGGCSALTSGTRTTVQQSNKIAEAVPPPRDPKRVQCEQRYIDHQEGRRAGNAQSPEDIQRDDDNCREVMLAKPPGAK